MPRTRVSQINYISGRGTFSFHKSRSKELAQKNIFHFAMLGFYAETFCLTNYVKRYSIILLYLNLQQN